MSSVPGTNSWLVLDHKLSNTFKRTVAESFSQSTLKEKKEGKISQNLKGKEVFSGRTNAWPSRLPGALPEAHAAAGKSVSQVSWGTWVQAEGSLTPLQPQRAWLDHLRTAGEVPWDSGQ